MILAEYPTLFEERLNQPFSLESLATSARFFSELAFRARLNPVDVPVSEFLPPTSQVGARLFDPQYHFLTAGYANALLYSLGRDRLLQFERQGVIHNSTLSGGSLMASMSAVNAYLLRGQRLFERDKYEQLSRSCHSARDFLKHNCTDYMPTF